MPKKILAILAVVIMLAHAVMCFYIGSLVMSHHQHPAPWSNIVITGLVGIAYGFGFIVIDAIFYLSESLGERLTPVLLMSIGIVLMVSLNLYWRVV